MRKLLLLMLCFLLFSNNQYAQVKIGAKKEKIERDIKYDSLSNYLGDNIYAYIGQELYVKPKNSDLKKFGYEGFYTKPDNNKQYIYELKDKYSISTPYEKLAGKTFRCISIEKKEFKIGMTPPKTYGLKGLSENYYFLELANEKDTVYYEYSKYEHNFPFVVLGYLKKIEEKYSKDKYILIAKNVSDFITGENLSFQPSTLWHFKEVLLEDKYYNITLLFSNDKNETIGIEDYRVKYAFIEENQANRLKQKYGFSMFTAAINGKIKVGMNEELVKLAWGEPIRINNSSYGQQWVYNNQYVYIKNGKVTGFN